jgi:hypothetical protein
MRFFSNDKDARDDQQGVDVRERAEDVNPDQAHDQHPERVQSDPVAVPQQRAGSPWSSTPDTADNPAAGDTADHRDDASDSARDASDPARDDAFVQDDTSARDDSGAVPADHERADGVVDAPADASANGHDDDANRPPFHDSGADADYSRTDSHGDDALRPDDSEVRHDGDDLVRSDSSDTATSGVGTGSHRADLDEPVDLALDDKKDQDDETVREDTTPPDHAVSDTAPDATVTSTTTTYGPDGTVTTTDADDDSSADARDSATEHSATGDSATGDSPAEESALKDDGGFSDPQAVDPVTDKPLDSDDSSLNQDSSDSAAAAPVVAAVPVAAAVATGAGGTPDTDSKPGSVTAPEVGTLFAADDAQSFRDQWRDVQLRFVDSPSEAAADAARLVDEAVDKLTEGLKAQKQALSGDHGEDTEKLRVELRGYRDILNRILDL